MSKRPVVVAVIGYQNSGKTELVEALIAQASRRGLATAHLKHDGHADEVARPNWEKPSSDTVRVAAAGARWTMLASRHGWLLHDWNDAAGDVDAWLRTLLAAVAVQASHVDVVFVEGAKLSGLPKVAVLGTESDWHALIATGVTNIEAVYLDGRWTDEAVERGRLLWKRPLFRATDAVPLLDFLLKIGAADI